MRNLAVTIGVVAVTAIALSAIALVIESGPIDDTAATLIAVGFASQDTFRSQAEEEEFRRIRAEAMENVADTDLPTFLRRPVTIR